MLENHTCSDPNTPGSPDLLASHIWKQGDGNEQVVHVEHERAASNTVDHYFISEEECVAMELAASKCSLYKATVADPSSLVWSDVDFFYTSFHSGIDRWKASLLNRLDDSSNRKSMWFGHQEM